ncbi:hypothetical protein [Rhodothalassium salexigens]|uniref:hypothetical protein n=1 Tax=Rhodothalassium salexigens TaxID=1086 RepID=UPI0018305297|nr:hypothetical protein [Rhodothalassium salexigens]MBB4210787.1 hypothetical protein [Rhodothalassium salexigens DSM 2132]
MGGRTRPATRAELEALIRTADAEGLPSIGTAAMLAFELCQREGDVIGTCDPDGRWHGLSWDGYRCRRPRAGGNPNPPAQDRDVDLGAPL